MFISSKIILDLAKEQIQRINMVISFGVVDQCGRGSAEVSVRSMSTEHRMGKRRYGKCLPSGKGGGSDQWSCRLIRSTSFRERSGWMM
jgi:hypothetical protein